MMKISKSAANAGMAILILVNLCYFSFADVEVANIDVLPNPIWLHENPQIEIFARCKVDGNFVSDAEAKADIYAPGLSSPIMSLTLNYDSDSKHYRYSFRSFFYETGRYRVEVTCIYNQDSSMASKELMAHELDLKIIKDGSGPIDAYMGGELRLYAEFRRDGELIPPSQDTFDVYIDKENVEQVSVPIIVDNYQEITVKIPLRPSYIDEEGVYDIKIVGEYEEGERISIEAEEKEFINVNTPLKIGMKDDKIKCPFNGACERDISVGVVFAAGSIDDLTLDSIEAVIVDKKAKGRKIYIDDLLCDDESDTCTVSLDIPSDLEPGPYDLFVTVAYPKISEYRYKSQDSIPLEIVLQLGGHVQDASGNIVDALIVLGNQDTGQTITRHTDASGKYTLDILPGTYDITLEFKTDKTRAKFYDVSIKDSDIVTISDTLIRYDRGHLNSGIPEGLRVVKVVVIEFALPFSDATVYLPYDSSKVNGDENNLQVYKCERWNFKKSSCSGDWIILSSKIYTIRDLIEFDTGSSGAFVVGERRSLRIDIDEDELKDKVRYMDEPVHVVGRVIDNEGNPVEGAVVECSFPRFNISETIVSTTDGILTVDINAPHVEGPVTLAIGAKGGPFIAYNETISLNILRSKQLDILGIPDVVDIKLDEPRVISFKLFNSGQTDLTDPIYLRVTGMSSDWYEILPVKIDSLSPGQQKPVNLKIRLTKELCGGRCKQFNLVNIEAKSNQISKVISFTLNIAQIEEDQSAGEIQGEHDLETETPQVPDEGSGIPGITGLVISVPSLGSPYILLSVVIVLVVLIISKKKTRGKRAGKGRIRAPVVASLHRVKERI